VAAQLPTRNSRSLIAGPPRLKPYCLRLKSGFVEAKFGRAAKSLLRSKKKPPPCNWLAPRLVMTLIAPVALMPAEVSDDEVEIWNSWIVSCEMLKIGRASCRERV